MLTYTTIIAVGRRGNGARFLWSLQRLNLSEKWGEAACVADIFACYFAYGHRSQYSCGIDKMYLFKRVRKYTATHADKPHFYDSAVLTRRTYSKEYAKVPPHAS